MKKSKKSPLLLHEKGLDANMIKLKNVTLEGPDLAGKTTLMSQIHKETNNKY